MNIDIRDTSSGIDSMSERSESNLDKFIWLTKDGVFATDLLNIYFGIDYMPNKIWLINVSPNITMEAFWVEVTLYLQNHFEEFANLSSLRIDSIVDSKTDIEIPTDGKEIVSSHMKDGSEIVCNLQSIDIWINLYLELKSTDHFAKIWVKMLVEKSTLIMQIK